MTGVPAVPDAPAAAGSEQRGLAFVRESVRLFADAARAHGVTERRIHIAGRTIALRFAGGALLPLLMPAFEHLEATSADAVDLTVHLFDSESTGVRMPPPPWPATAYGAKGEISGFNHGGVRALYQPGIDILHLLDVAGACAVYWAPTFRLIPYWESSFPLRTILHWWLQPTPFQPIHSGAVGTAAGGVLIAGISGSGKSTATLACLDSDLLYAGDDYVIVNTDAPWVHSAYGTAKLEGANVARFEWLRPLMANPGQLETEKAMFFVARHFPEKITSGFPLRAIVLPRVTGQRDTAIRRATSHAALLAIAPTTVMHLAGAEGATFEKITQLVRRVPSYILEAGTDLRQIPAAIRGLLKELRQ
jgi:hypothetical protein